MTSSRRTSVPEPAPGAGPTDARDGAPLTRQGPGAPRSPAQVRAELVSTLALDLIGPGPGHTCATEALRMPPSRWYLTGFLVPSDAPEAQKFDPLSREEVAVGAEGAGVDDDSTPEPSAARKVLFPSSMGLSVLVPAAAEHLEVLADWGDYKVVLEDEASAAHAPAGAPEVSPPRSKRELWQRTPHQASLRVDLGAMRRDLEVPGSNGLFVVATVRPVAPGRVGVVPPGTRVVSVFLVNRRVPSSDARRDESFTFQARLSVSCAPGFVPRPSTRGGDSKDWDELINDLQYRALAELAVGHGVATRVEPGSGSSTVSTTWIPTAEVEKVVPGEVPGVELRMEALAAAPTVEVLEAMLQPLAEQYAAWLTAQKETPIADDGRRAVALELLGRADQLRKRLAAGIHLLATDAQAREAFQIANRAMARQQRQRAGDAEGKGPAPAWRPFQLAFVLLNLRGIVTPTHADRETVDLLFFPTGGGKTEAYLGIAAFTLALRRLRDPGLTSAGVTVLMRYTLRLLTLDQLSRAATLICALELERREDVTKLGPWPFEIGLWVGQGATPNRMGKKGDKGRETARARTIAFKNDEKKALPIPLESCPWCGRKFTRDAFVLLARGKPNSDQPTDLRVQCVNRQCEFSARSGVPLPIVAVDEPIYRRLPCFLIATVDKFAGLPWLAQAGALLGKNADRYDSEGFYGPGDPGSGQALERPLLPPELIIQDELHLISGPLGTMAGLYETAVDSLSSYTSGGKKIRAKVIASTATVRRAEKQIHALFARTLVDVFPPPGPDIRDSFFAKVVPASDAQDPRPGTKNARMYVGLAAQGRSHKVVLLRTYLALLAAAERAYAAEGGSRREPNPADPYMTLLGYFNSLRELGGSRRIVEDEVRSRLRGYGRRLRFGETRGPFDDRTISFEPLELTSRESTAKVAESKRRLGLAFASDERVDVALATNMISVGLDITRLGLMVVFGQPKTTSEYIQATSRVGRDDTRPGLVLTLFNVHRPRDRSHYERFETFHEAFYRSVEATSVTPFSPRAIDRGLAGVTVALARHGLASLTAPQKAVAMEAERKQLDFVADELAERAARHDHELPKEDVDLLRSSVRARVGDLLDAWGKLAHAQSAVGAGLQYQREEGGTPPLLRDPLDPELATIEQAARKFKAHRSLRDVEPNVQVWIRTLAGDEVEHDTVEDDE